MKGHTPSGYPAFIVYCLVCKPDGSTEMKEHVVIDLQGMNWLAEPDMYPLPTQDKVLQLLEGKHFISIMDTCKIFHQ